MRKNSVLTSPRLEKLRKEKRKVFWRKIFFYLILIVAILVGLSYGSKNQKININNIEVVGNKIIDTEVIKNIAKEKISGKYLYFFPKTNFILYPNSAIKNELSNRYRRFKNVSVNLKDLRTIEITVNERETKYTWCGENMPESNANDNDIKCYFLDADGYIFDEAPYFSQDVYVRFYGSNNINKENPIGSYFASDIFNKLVSFKQSIEEMNLKPKAFSLLENGDMKMFLPRKGIMTNMPEVIFKINANYDKVAENLQSALTTEPLQTDFKNKYNSLIYIDLRFDNKVYYKFSSSNAISAPVPNE